MDLHFIAQQLSNFFDGELFENTQLETYVRLAYDSICVDCNRESLPDVLQGTVLKKAFVLCFLFNSAKILQTEAANLEGISSLAGIPSLAGITSIKEGDTQMNFSSENSATTARGYGVLSKALIDQFNKDISLEVERFRVMRWRHDFKSI